MAEWCTITEVQFWMSDEGVEVATNDDQTQTTPDLTLVTGAIIQGRLWLSQFLVQKYDLSLITSANEWVKWSTAVAAAVILLRRKGGVVSPGLQEAYESLQEFLKGVQTGGLIAPGLFLTASPGITVSNVTMDDRYNRAKVRAVQSISWPSGLSKLQQFVDMRDRTNGGYN